MQRPHVSTLFGLFLLACGSPSADVQDAGRGDALAGDGNVLPTTLPQPFDVGVSYPTTIHVATTGNDTTGNGSSGAPFATIRRGLQAATPGTRVLVAAGTYGAQGYIAG